MALGWNLAEGHLQHDEGVVQARDDSELEVRCVPSVRTKTVKNRVHLDLATTSTEDRELLLERLFASGARDVDIGQGDAELIELPDGRKKPPVVYARP